MNQHLRRIYPSVLGITALLGLIGVFSPELEGSMALPLFVILMVTTGLPHGATDHLVDRFQREIQGEEFRWDRFLAVYLGAMLLYGAAWWFMPLMSLALFILISAYHFGQSQLLYVKGEENRLFKCILSMSWGLMVLCAIVGLHPEESGQVLAVLLPHTQWSALQLWAWPLIMVTGGIALGLLSVAWRQQRLTTKAYLLEWVNLAVLLVLCLNTSLLTSFAVYFGLWHSIASIMAEVRILKTYRPEFGIGAFVQAALPFSLISFAGIGMLLAAGYFLAAYVSPYLLFFMAISVLTLPHMVFMQRLYTRHAQPMRMPHPIEG